ncbi:MAG: zinc-binding dehydrogenase [Burkholderiaceae bacterium]|nr:zinc-binding dehydrogenase [Burkholderiaceae bacterium]
MKAWVLDSLGGEFALRDVATPEAPRGGVVVRMRATPMLSYLGAYVRGELPRYAPVEAPFTPGTNGVGVVDAVGPGVYHFAPGDRVLVNPLLVANEAVRDPAQILIGLTQISPDAQALMRDWPSGTLREQAVFPASVLVPAAGLDALADERLATLGKFIVPFGGLRRGALQAGETLVVHGATGYFGSAAVLLGLALGASRVVAAGRNQAALERLRRAGGDRVLAVRMTGDVSVDSSALRAACDGGADMAFDIVGRADSANGTLAALKSLRRGGRLVVMGSLGPSLPIDYNELMINDWSLIGQFMYDRMAYPSLLNLVRAGLVDLGAVAIRRFGLAELPRAIEAAATMSALDCTVVTMA